MLVAQWMLLLNDGLSSDILFLPVTARFGFSYAILNIFVPPMHAD